jgi:hypothetical protein
MNLFFSLVNTFIIYLILSDKLEWLATLRFIVDLDPLLIVFSNDYFRLYFYESTKF